MYEVLRDEIIRCELVPGERLILREIADRFNISSIPIREALRLLDVEGWIEHKPHIGAVVSSISKASIVETFTIKEGLESVATRVAAGRTTPDRLEKLQQIWNLMDDVLRQGRHEEWGDFNEQFHETIAWFTDMQLLIDMSRRIMQRWNRIRNFYFKEIFVPNMQNSHMEHRAIMKALSARDEDKAERLAKEHNRHALNYYMDHLSIVESPDRSK